MPLKRIRVLIVDDSPVDREVIEAVLAVQPDLEVVGFAVDALDAREKIRSFAPDVITLDVNMEGMNGIGFLRNLMRLRPMPVVMCSARSADSAEAQQALALGALHFVPKPAATAQAMNEFRAALVAQVRSAAYATVAGPGPGPEPDKV